MAQIIQPFFRLFGLSPVTQSSHFRERVENNVPLYWVYPLGRLDRSSRMSGIAIAHRPWRIPEDAAK